MLKMQVFINGELRFSWGEDNANMLVSLIEARRSNLNDQESDFKFVLNVAELEHVKAGSEKENLAWKDTLNLDKDDEVTIKFVEETNAEEKKGAAE